MKKLLAIILAALTVMFGNVCHGQIGFVSDDALTVFNGDSVDVTHIIAYYANKPGATKAEIDAIILANPLLRQSEVLKKYMKIMRVAEGDAGEPSGLASGLSGLNVTNIADGLAKFLIERGKQELSMAFFDKMREEFIKYPEIKALFPLTFEILDEVENHNILTLLQELKDAFAKDLMNGPTNLLALRYIEDVDCRVYKNREKTACEDHNLVIKKIRDAARTRTASVSLHIAQGILDGSNIIAILGNVVTDTSFCESKDNIAGLLKLSYVLMDMLRASKESDGLFINEARLRQLFSNKELLTIFLGLGLEKNKIIECFKPDQLKIGEAGLDSIFQIVLEGRSKFLGKVSSFENLNVSYSSLKTQLRDGKPVEPNTYRSFVFASTLAVERVTSGLSAVFKFEQNVELKKILGNIDIGADFVIDIHQKNYTGIFNDIIRFVDENDFFGDNTKAKAKLVKYLSFGANLASAQNSDEVKDALNAATLPPGSFSVKQKSKFSIGLNAYVGYAWDFNGGLYGRNVYAPFGIASSWGINKGNGGAVSLFVSIIDVGSLVAYRLNNSATDTLKQEVRLESIISPSAQVIYALPRLPVSICAGVRRTPKLVFEGQTEFRVVTPETVLNLSILIDIPLFNIKVTPYD
jgi:hypothetical protein